VSNQPDGQRVANDGRSVDERTRIANAPADQKDDRHEPSPEESLPKPIMKSSGWRWAWVWLVPLAALAAAGFYAVKLNRSLGPVVTITLNDGSDIKVQQTMVTCHGVSIGEIISSNLSRDRVHAEVKIRLQKEDADFAKEGAVFWVVRPQISLENISGLNTVVSGPYLEAQPGSGAEQLKFDGLDKPPEVPVDGLHMRLTADRLTSLQHGTQVYYRSMPVGEVESVALADDATHINIQLVIRERYRKLVQTNSVFWVVSAANLQGSVLTGIQFKLGSLHTILDGGVEFATPDDGKGSPADDGAVFPLMDEAKKEWLQWKPLIWVGSAKHTPQP
jgi:paraquat-inducible protein B